MTDVSPNVDQPVLSDNSCLSFLFAPSNTSYKASVNLLRAAKMLLEIQA